ncbi:MAG: cation-translocating P-type ATPase [Clostridia bacterium]|nr:cation-translocating P-type ATPase [Clostridia bacterium]
MKFYLESAETVFNEVGSSENGLSEQEALARLEKNGKNKLDEGKKDSLLKKFVDQLKDPMIIMLIVAAAISCVTGFLKGEGLDADVFIILFVVIVNAVLGVYQESKAEAAIEALQKMSAAKSKVIRGGKMQIIHSEDLVVGDVIVLEAGDSVPADARIFESASMKIEEAALTGESVPVNKAIKALGLGSEDDVPLGDRKNMAYMGSSVVYGRGTAVVTATGMDTEMGKIADALAKAEDSETPLQKKLNQLSKILSVIVIIICVAIFAIQLIADYFNGAFSQSGAVLETVLECFMIAVSLAVAAIPEGLAAVVTIVLSIGVTNMSKKNAVIRKLTAVETLGCAQIICSDKTGTLTQNKMTVVEEFTKDKTLLAQGMSLCTDVKVEGEEVLGEPTEVALVNYALSMDMNKNDLQKSMPRVAEAPFDSGRKMMSTIHDAQGKLVQYTKGAPDVVLALCTKYFDGEKAVDMTYALREEIAAANKQMADRAFRVLCLAMKEDAVTEFTEPTDIEKELTFVGLTGMIDPVRPEVKDAIIECNEAGIRPIMITGDHRDTAVAIAKELGIIDDESASLTGAALSKMSDEEFDANVEKYSVYARVQPEHKTRIVNAWHKKGMVTAMTGDGVNDAPSIKSADIGVGMGITGTDVTKNVADMVLSDDNFATIVHAVGEGRRIYDNIRKAIQFLLSSNLSEVLIILIGTVFMGLILKAFGVTDNGALLAGTATTVLLPTHLLWINLVTDCFPALALGLEKAEPNIMKRKPRSSSDGIFAQGMGVDVLYQGIIVTILTLSAYVIGYVDAFNEGLLVSGETCKLAMTMAFLTMSMCEIFHSFNMRSQRQSIFKLPTQNWAIWGSMVLSLILTGLVIEIKPIANMFNFYNLDWKHYLIAMALAISIIPIVEIVKACQRAASKNK